MGYRVKEMFYTLQGEGARSGRAAVFCRFTGCNLWSGREEDRTHAACQFCDTDFIGGKEYREPGFLALAAQQMWGGRAGKRYIVLTGGEPTLQVDSRLVTELRALGFEVAMETNGTIEASSVDWLTVSPKAGTKLVQTWGNELKIVWPQPLNLDELATLRFEHFYLQPMAGRDGAIDDTVAACLKDPRWKLSLQVHKLVGLS